MKKKRYLDRPAAEDWSDIRGVRWLTNGAVAVREGHPRPRTVRDDTHERWFAMDRDQRAQLSAWISQREPVELQDSGVTLNLSDRVVSLYLRDDDEPVALDVLFAPTLAGCTLWQSADPLGMVQCVQRDRIVALVMPVSTEREPMRRALGLD